MCLGQGTQVIRDSTFDLDPLRLHIKNQTINVTGLLRRTPAPCPPGFKRVIMLFHMPLGDCHRVFAPCNMTLRETMHLPGLLFPLLGEGGLRWIPNLLVTNERVVFIGDVTSLPGKTASAEIPGTVAATPPSRLLRSVCLIGSMCVGKIHVEVDERVRTNHPDPLGIALRRRYDEKVAPAILRGDELAHFKFGSAVVVIADVPAGAKALVGRGDRVMAGNAIYGAPV